MPTWGRKHRVAIQVGVGGVEQLGGQGLAARGRDDEVDVRRAEGVAAGGAQQLAHRLIGGHRIIGGLDGLEVKAASGWPLSPNTRPLTVTGSPGKPAAICAPRGKGGACWR
jgi:hypothetical protein